ncbi:MAG: glutamine-hydrolyzing carbamoyl-phosphate synthase small subunit [Candidatus Aminicenantaceae bacterium]
MKPAKLILQSGEEYAGTLFGAEKPASGEVVFNTGMTGYVETLTDPSYYGQILVLTHPLIGNYGVPGEEKENGLLKHFESERIHVSGLIVSSYSSHFSHWHAKKSLGDWLKEQHVPALQGIDTRALTKKLRTRGAMLGKLVLDKNIPFYDPNRDALTEKVSGMKPEIHNPAGNPSVALIDCGVKFNIIRCLVKRGCRVIRVPWDYDYLDMPFDGVVISNGPGDLNMNQKTIESVKKCLEREIPTFGICMGNQILALAAGAKTFKMKYGHRSQNQPCVNLENRRCFITSQNHGFAVNTATLPQGWEPWFENLNDGTNEGIRHVSRPFRSVQFHPEHNPGPVDTEFLFDEFLESVKA